MKTVNMRTKIVVPTILLFILSLGASTWLTYRVSRDAMEQERRGIKKRQNKKKVRKN